MNEPKLSEESIFALHDYENAIIQYAELGKRVSEERKILLDRMAYLESRVAELEAGRLVAIQDILYILCSDCKAIETTYGKPSGKAAGVARAIFLVKEYESKITTTTRAQADNSTEGKL